MLNESLSEATFESTQQHSEINFQTFNTIHVRKKRQVKLAAASTGNLIVSSDIVGIRAFGVKNLQTYEFKK